MVRDSRAVGGDHAEGLEAEPAAVCPPWRRLGRRKMLDSAERGKFSRELGRFLARDERCDGKLK